MLAGIHTFLWYFAFALSLLWHIPLMFWVKHKGKNMPPDQFDKYVNRVASRWALNNIKRSGAKFHIEGLENIPDDTAVVFVGNHQGNFDIPAILAYFPTPHGYISKIEIFKVPILRHWMKMMHCVFIDRSNIRQTSGALLEGVETLKAGHSLVLFPEGTRSKSNIVGEFKPASFKLATRPGVPIVPISISGTYKLLEANGGKIKPGNVYVKIHPAIETKDLEDKTALPNKVREIIISGLKE